MADALAAALSREPTVDFAYLPGSFLDTQPFRDIDVAVMFTRDAEPDISGAALAPGDRLEHIIGHPIGIPGAPRGLPVDAS